MLEAVTPAAITTIIARLIAEPIWEVVLYTPDTNPDSSGLAPVIAAV
ncbi:MAG TPA: hypothetical protein VEY70_26905 [Metabacillus sp.]|nr:hypothetical protein [Metabacillus sp.]